MAGPGAPIRHHHSSHRLRTAAGAMWLINTARAFLVRLPLSFGPPNARPYTTTVRWASAPSSVPSSPPSLLAPIKLPRAVSPSSLGDFKTCPRLYRFRHIERVPEPASEVMVRGSMVHDALDQVCMTNWFWSVCV